MRYLSWIVIGFIIVGVIGCNLWEREASNPVTPALEGESQARTR